MQVDNNKRKMPTSVEIVDVPHPTHPTSTSTSTEISFKPDTVSAGTMKLSKKKCSFFFKVEI